MTHYTSGDAVPNEEVARRICGHTVRLSWAYRNAAWILRRINPDGTCELVTPRSGRHLTAKVSDLVFTHGSARRANGEPAK